MKLVGCMGRAFLSGGTSVVNPSRCGWSWRPTTWATSSSGSAQTTTRHRWPLRGVWTRTSSRRQVGEDLGLFQIRKEKSGSHESFFFLLVGTWLVQVIRFLRCTTSFRQISHANSASFSGDTSQEITGVSCIQTDKDFLERMDQNYTRTRGGVGGLA